MRRLSIGSCLLFLILLFVPVTHAQTRYIVGASGQAAFDNYNAGILAGVEVPFAKHFELDLKDTFSPIESHVALGIGRANNTNVGGFIWLNSKFGFNGAATDSMYDVTKVAKDANYVFGGVALRTNLGGMPSRFTFDYIRQFNNGVSATGLETSQLQGGDVGFTNVFGCTKNMCVRMTEDLVFGRVLTQGNPVCDGSLGGAVTCRRSSAVSGGVTASVQFVFGKGRGGF